MVLRRGFFAAALLAGFAFSCSRPPATPEPALPAIETRIAPPAPSAAEARSFEPRARVAMPDAVEMRVSDGINMHTGFGAQGEHSKSKVRLRVAAGDQARVEDAGTLRKYVMDTSRGVKEDETSWELEWRGTASVAGDGMTLALTSTKTTCKRAASDYGGPKQPAACREIAGAVKLVCEAEEVEVNGDATPVWRCESEAGDLGGTSFPWVFPRQGCLQRSGGKPMRGGLLYRVCEPDDADAAED